MSIAQTNIWAHEQLVVVSAMVLRPVDTTSEEFENATLFLRLGLPSTLTVTKSEIISIARV